MIYTPNLLAFAVDFHLHTTDRGSSSPLLRYGAVLLMRTTKNPEYSDGFNSRLPALLIWGGDLDAIVLISAYLYNEYLAGVR